MQSRLTTSISGGTGTRSQSSSSTTPAGSRPKWVTPSRRCSPIAVLSVFLPGAPSGESSTPCSCGKRGALKDARRELETVLAQEPANRPAQDLLEIVKREMTLAGQ
jgi:hypothetical protein